MVQELGPSGELVAALTARTTTARKVSSTAQNKAIELATTRSVRWW